MQQSRAPRPAAGRLGTGGRVARRGKPGRPPNINENSLMRRLQCVLSVQRGEMGMDEACEMYDISTRTFYRWLRSKSKLIELTGYDEEAQDENGHEASFRVRGRSPRKNISDLPANAKRMPRTNQRRRPFALTQLRSVRQVGDLFNAVAGPSSVAKTTTPFARNHSRPVGAATSSRIFASSHYRMPPLHHGPYVSDALVTDERNNGALAPVGASRDRPVFTSTPSDAPKTHHRVNVSHRMSPAQGSGTVNGVQGDKGASGNQTSTLALRKRSFPESADNDRRAKRARDTLAVQELEENDEGEDTTNEAHLQTEHPRRTLRSKSSPDSTSDIRESNSKENPTLSINGADLHRGRRTQIQDRPTPGLQRDLSRQHAVKLGLQNNTSGARAHPSPAWVSVASVAYIDTSKHRLEIMSGRKKVVIAFYRGALATDIKDAISRRFAMLTGAQWALMDQNGDEIVVSEGMPSGCYTLKVLGRGI